MSLDRFTQLFVFECEYEGLVKQKECVVWLLTHQIILKNVIYYIPESIEHCVDLIFFVVFTSEGANLSNSNFITGSI